MASISSTPGMRESQGNGPRKLCWCAGTVASVLILRSAILRSTIAIDQLKVLKTHVTRALCPLGGDELVDACAQVLEHEILVGGCFAVVDFLGPLFEWQLDPKGLVDRESDVEKVQAIDAGDH